MTAWEAFKHEVRMRRLQRRWRKLFHDCPRCGLPTASERLWCYVCLEEMGVS